MAVPTITNNSPAPGNITWGAFTIQYNGVAYSISGGSTAARWVWWRYNGGSSIIEAGNDIPEGKVVNLLNNPFFADPDPVDATLPANWLRPGVGHMWYNAAHTTTRNANGEVELKTGATGLTAPSIDQVVALTPGATYRLSFKVKSSNTTGNKIYGMILNAAGTAEVVRFTGLNIFSAAGTSYTMATGTAVIPAGVTTGRLFIMSYDQALNTLVTLDNIEFGLDVPAALTDDDLVLFGNKNGIGIRVQAASVVDGELIVDGSIFANALAANQISSQHIVTQGLDAGLIKFGTMDGDRISVNTLDGNVIVANTLAGNAIIADSITSNELATGAVTANEIAAGAVTANKIGANAVTADKLSALIGLLGTLLVTDPAGGGRSITLDPEQGIVVTDPDGSPIFTVPTDPTQNLSATIDIVARSLTALGVIAMRNPINELAPGAGFYIRKGTTPPATPPTVSQTWPVVVSDPSWLVGGDYTYSTNQAKTDKKLLNISEGATGFYLITYDIPTKTITTGPEITNGGTNRWNPATDSYEQLIDLGPKPSPEPAQGYAGSARYIIAGYRGSTGIPCIWIYDGFWTFLRRADLTVSGTNSASPNYMLPAIGCKGDGDDNLTLVYTTNPGGLLQVRTLWTNSATPATLLLYTTTVNVTIDAWLTSVAVGTFDYAAERIVISDSNARKIYVLTSSSGARNTNEEFPVPNNIDLAMKVYWDSADGRFNALSYDGQVVKFSKNIWTDNSQSRLFISNEWETDAGQKSTQGPVGSFTPLKRAYFTITAPPKPAAVTKTRFYMGKVDPQRTNMWAQPPGGIYASTLSIDVPTFTGSNPVAVSTIPDTTPAFMQADGLDPSGQALVKVNGDGSGRFGPFSWDNTGANTTNPFYAKLYTATQQTNLANVAWTTLTFTQVDWDTVGNMADVTNNQIVIRAAGKYEFSAAVGLPNNATATRRIIGLWKNGIEMRRNDLPSVSGAIPTLEVHDEFECAVGDTIVARVWHNSGATASTVALPGGSGTFTGARLVGRAVTLTAPPPILPDEANARCRIYNTTSPTLTTATWTPLSMLGVYEDTNAMSGEVSNVGRITVPYNGLYLVRSKLRFAANATGTRGMSIKRNAVDGTALIDVDVSYVAGSGSPATTMEQFNEVVLNAGDYLSLQAYQSSGGNLALQGSNENYSYLGLRLMQRYY